MRLFGYVRPISEALKLLCIGHFDADIELLLGNELEIELSNGVIYFERQLLNVLRQGQSIPVVPLILIKDLP